MNTSFFTIMTKFNDVICMLFRLRKRVEDREREKERKERERERERLNPGGGERRGGRGNTGLKVEEERGTKEREGARYLGRESTLKRCQNVFIHAVTIFLNVKKHKYKH